MVKLFVKEPKKQITIDDISKDIYVERSKDEKTATVKYSNLVVVKVSIEKNDTDEVIKEWVKQNPTYLKATLNKLKAANEKRKEAMAKRKKQRQDITEEVKEDMLRATIEEKLTDKANKKKKK
jgi:ribosomal protein L12E/L44/L45/RPP1/RPP2